MKPPRFIPKGGAGCIMFLTRIFLTSSSRKISCSARNADSPERRLAVGIGEVDLVDRFPVKFRRQKGCHLRQGVEPFGDFSGFFAVLKPAVDLLANGLRQPRYFASSCHKNFFFLALLTFINLY